MPGLRAEELPSERLSVGKQIAYYSRRFVTGDTRGQRVAVVMSVDDTPENELPVSLDAGDSLLLTVFMRRSRDVLGNELNLEHANEQPVRVCTPGDGADESVLPADKTSTPSNYTQSADTDLAKADEYVKTVPMWWERNPPPSEEIPRHLECTSFQNEASPS
ncbi:hypothetical protein L914_01833 [Phytophthora nicotianae]|uniref:Uncharacterized protein n=1 Tax=Phytophthora nicotianae TaxID=4792 RepID=W2P2H2_PHYNI|nr:hypothetical protein L914_01833 [Phytophthora nicotianae]